MRTLGLAVLVLLTGCLKSDPAPPLTGPVGGEERPGLQTMVLKTLDGKEWRLSQDKGQVVLLDVWATWCEPCADSLPMYHDLLKEFGPRGFKLYGINVDADSKVVTPFLKELKVEIPVLVDPGAATVEGALKVSVMPTAYLIDRQGKLRHVHDGFAEEFLPRYMKEIEELLAEKAQ